MSHRGIKAKAEADWQTHQFHLGYLAAKSGLPGAYSDQHYQRGWRAGVKRHQLESVTPRCRANKGVWPNVMQCTHLARATWWDEHYSGEWVPVCGVHARVARRAGYQVRDATRWDEQDSAVVEA